MSDKITVKKIQEIGHLNSLDFYARQIVEGFITGMHRSPFHGFSVEFAEHRAYNKGESIRFVDWKLFGRTGKLYVKRFQEETNLKCQIVIDASSSMYFPVDAATNKLQYSVYSAAALVHLLNKQRDAAGLTIFSEDIDYQVPARLSRPHMHNIYAQLDALLNSKYRIENKKQTQLSDVLHQVAEAVGKRSLVVIFSDMFENGDPEKLFKALEHLRYNKHEVIIFHVFDGKFEQQLELENRPHKLIDMESGDVMKLHPGDVREGYSELLTAYYEQVKTKCLQYKADFIIADINSDFDKVLTSFLLRRQKMY